MNVRPSPLRARRLHLVLLAALLAATYFFLERRYVAERRDLVLQQDVIAQALTRAYLEDHGPVFEHDGALYAGRYRINWSDTLVDAIKADSGCGVSIFQNDERIATTATLAHSKERAIGSKANPEIKRLVLEQGHTYRGVVDALGQEALAVYTPFKDAADHTIGMIATYREMGEFSRELLYFRLLLGGTMAALFAVIVLVVLAAERQERQTQRARRKLVEERAKLQARLFESMTQELRTPLSAMLVFAQSLVDALANDDKTRAVAERVRGEAKDLLAAIDDIHDYAKIEGGTLALQVSEVDLKPLVAEAQARGEALIGARGLRLAVDVPDDLPSVNGDPARLRQVLTNLIAHAVHTTDEGRVAVKARAERDAVVVEVSDTGAGLSEQALAQVWDPFQGVAAHAQPGSGLALSIVRGLVQRMGGEVAAASKLGKGSVFRVRLPRASVTA